MNTDRIKIINQDRSQSSVPQASEIIGYTVVKAEKGPVEPVFISANNLGMVYETLGYTSKAYPDLQDVIDFNSEYGLYVSAPYDTAAANKVPVAYVTPAGILQRSLPVSITGSRIEDVALSDVSITGINSIDADQTVMVPVGKEGSMFNGTATDLANVLTYTADTINKLEINFGFDLSSLHGELGTPATSKLHFLNPSVFSVSETSRVLRNASGSSAVLMMDIPGLAAPIELHIISLADNKLAIRDNAGHDIVPSLDADGSGFFTKITIDSAAVRSGLLDQTYQAYFSAAAINLVWSSATFRESVKVYWKATLDQTAVYATIYQKYLSERVTTLSFPKQTVGNKISFTAVEKSTPSSYSSQTIAGSIFEEDVDGFGAPLGFKDKLASQALVDVAVLKTFEGGVIFTATGTSVSAAFTPAPIVLSRGSRTVSDASLELGWTEAMDPEMDRVEVFFNPKLLTSATTIFTSLASTQKLSRFVASRTVAPASATEDLPQLTYGPNYYISTNLFVRKSGFTKEDYTSALTGAYAMMIARCIDVKLGGCAPMFLNSGGVGGQLNAAVKKAVYKYTAEQLTYLDSSNYNPIIRDPAYGVMVTGQKTARGGELSDWSYIGHSSAFLRFQRMVRDQVMFPQIGKPNNPFYQSLRGEQIKTFLRTRTDGPSRIWATGTVDTVNVNTDAVKAARQFFIEVVVKVDIFSEGVTLTFANENQSTTVGV